MSTGGLNQPEWSPCISLACHIGTGQWWHHWAGTCEWQGKPPIWVPSITNWRDNFAIQDWFIFINLSQLQRKFHEPAFWSGDNLGGVRILTYEYETLHWSCHWSKIVDKNKNITVAIKHYYLESRRATKLVTVYLRAQTWLIKILWNCTEISALKF